MLGDNGRMDRSTSTDPALRETPSNGTTRPGSLAAAVALLVLVVIAASLAGPWRPEPSNPGIIQPPSVDDFAPLITNPIEGLFESELDSTVEPWNLNWLGFVLLGVILLWAVYFGLRRLRRYRLPGLPEGPDDAGIELADVLPGGGDEPHLPTLARGVTDADAELRGRLRPTDAVIAAWVALERAAERSGVARDPAATPTEFTVAVLDRTPADPEATRALLGLYLRARFSGDYMTDTEVRAAADALHALAAGLRDVEDYL